jgi:hypothetical protein
MLSTTGRRSIRARRSARAASAAAVSGVSDALRDSAHSLGQDPLLDLEVGPEGAWGHVRGKDEQWGAALGGLCEAGDGVGEARALVNARDGDLAAGAGVAIGHCHRAALVAGGVECHTRRV